MVAVEGRLWRHLNPLELRKQRRDRARERLHPQPARGRQRGAKKLYGFRLVAEGPPFDLESLELERHDVFVGEREVVFLFEGESAPAAVEALSHNPAVLKAALRWRGILAGRPRLLQQRFGWTR